MLAQNPGDVLSWLTDDEGNLWARIRKKTDNTRIFEILDRSGNIWKVLMTFGLEDALWILSFTADGDAVWALSNRGRDRISLVRMDIATGEETLIYADPQVDLRGTIISYLTKEPLVAIAYPDYQKIHFFNPQIEDDALMFLEQHPIALGIESADYDERVLTVSTSTAKGYAYYLFNRDTHEKEVVCISLGGRSGDG